jgi:hypothetical protein
MESSKVDMFMMSNSKYFEGHHLMAVREKLLSLDESKWGMVQTLQFKDPTTSIIVSLLGGQLGIDIHDWRYWNGNWKTFNLWWFRNLGDYRLVLNYGCYS